MSSVMTRARLLYVCLLVVLSASLAPAGRDWPSAKGERTTLASTVLVLDESIRALGDSAVDARAVLRGIAPRLPTGANPAVATSIDGFLRRIPPRASTDFVCGEDFVRVRARQELERIRETVLGSTPPALAPQFCYATPYAIDASSRPSVIEFYGFDFDAARVEMFLVSDSDYKDVSAALVRHNHYHVTLRIGGANGVKLAPGSLTLGLTWGHLIAHAIPIVHASTPLCRSAVVEIPAGKSITVEPSLLPNAAPRAALASPALVAHATLDYQSNAVIATVCAVAHASRGGDAIYSGCANEYVASLDPDRTIEGILGPLEAGLSATPSGRASDSVAGGPSSFVQRWVVGGLSPSSGTGRRPRITTVLGPVRVVLTAPERCISAIAFAEANQAGALGTAAVRSLGKQLSSVDPRIVSLRPRFAPARVPRVGWAQSIRAPSHTARAVSASEDRQDKYLLNTEVLEGLGDTQRGDTLVRPGFITKGRVDEGGPSRYVARLWGL